MTIFKENFEGFVNDEKGEPVIDLLKLFFPQLYW